MQGMKSTQTKQEKVLQSRARSSSASNDGNHWKFSISVMGATHKQRSIYINTWIDKKKQAVRQTYGQTFHIKHASSDISLDLYVHDIENNTEIHKIWDSIILNVIVLPYNHTSDSVDKPLKQLIRELPHTNIPLIKLFSKTLLICPSNFHSMTKDQYIKQTNKVSQGLLDLIYNGLGQLRAQSLNLMAADIIMMESGRKSSLLPTGKDWRVIAAEYTLKNLIFIDRDRKAFIAWILNIPKPLNAQDIMVISQRLKQWTTSRRRVKDVNSNSNHSSKQSTKQSTKHSKTSKTSKPSKPHSKPHRHHRKTKPRAKSKEKMEAKNNNKKNVQFKRRNHSHKHSHNNHNDNHKHNNKLNIQSRNRHAATSRSVGSHAPHAQKDTYTKPMPAKSMKRSMLSAIVKDFEQDDGIEATLNEKYKQIKKEKEKENSPISPISPFSPLSIADLSKNNNINNNINNIKQQRKEDEVMNPDLAALIAMSDDDEDETQQMANIVHKPIHKPIHKAMQYGVRKKTAPMPNTKKLQHTDKKVQFQIAHPKHETKRIAMDKKEKEPSHVLKKETPKKANVKKIVHKKKDLKKETVTPPQKQKQKQEKQKQEKEKEEKEDESDSYETGSDDTDSDESQSDEDESDTDTDTDTDSDSSTNDTNDDTNDDESDSDESDDNESDSDESDTHKHKAKHSKKKKRKHKNKTASLKEFCTTADLNKYYRRMVKLGFKSSSQFLDLNDKDLDELIKKLEMLFKDEKQFRKVLHSAQIACGMKEPMHMKNHSHSKNRLELSRHDSFSPLSTYNHDGSFFDTMEPGISKMALIDLTKQMREFTKISDKCGITLSKLGSTYEAAQIEMDRVYMDYKRQIDEAHAKAKGILHSFVSNKQDKIVSLQKTMKMAVNTMKKCEAECCREYKSGNQDKISQIIQNTKPDIKLPSDFSVSSWKFDVEYVEKLDIFPPVLQPDDIPYYTPILGNNHRSSNSNSQSSISSLQDIIENNLKSQGQVENDVLHSPIHLASLSATSPLGNSMNTMTFPTQHPQIVVPQKRSSIIFQTPNMSNQKSSPDTNNKPTIRRNSIVLGDFDPNLNETHTLASVVSPVARPPPYMTNPYNAALINPYNPMQAAQIAQQQWNNQFINPIAAQHIAAAQQAAMLQQQQQMQMQQRVMQQQQQQQHHYTAQQQQQNMSNYINGTNGSEDIKANENEIRSNEFLMSHHKNKYVWLETKDLWRGGRVTRDADTVTITGSVCVIADIEICRRNGVFCWEIYVEKISNRCWIGILPGPISSINWKIGECPPTNNRAIGIENTYGFIYKSTTKCSSIGRAPKNRDHIRFKLDIQNNLLCGSLNDKQINKVFYKGADIPSIACIAIINSTGKGKFQIREMQ